MSYLRARTFRPTNGVILAIVALLGLMSILAVVGAIAWQHPVGLLVLAAAVAAVWLLSRLSRRGGAYAVLGPLGSIAVTVVALYVLFG